jgi:hypothetical protein
VSREVRLQTEEEDYNEFNEIMADMERTIVPVTEHVSGAHTCVLDTNAFMSRRWRWWWGTFMSLHPWNLRNAFPMEFLVASSIK